MTAPAAAELEPAEIAARSGSNFLIGFRCLSAQRRSGMTAIYAFCRVVDDAVDDAADARDGAERLAFWRAELEAAERGTPRTPVGRALQRAFADFGGDGAALRELMLGVAMDLDGTDYADQEQLEVYCHRVASAVGLACLPVLGASGPDAERYAVELGRALQFANILRDLGADARAGRVYVPRTWLRDSGVAVDWLRGEPAGSGVAAAEMAARLAKLRDLVAGAARTHFAAADAALRRLPPTVRRRLLPPRIMGVVYRDLLGRLERSAVDLAGPRMRVPRLRKLWLVAAELCKGAR